MLKIIPFKARRYRVKRKLVKPKKFNVVVMTIAFLCAALAIPLLLIATPFVLCALGLLLIANACNELRIDE